LASIVRSFRLTVLFRLTERIILPIVSPVNRDLAGVFFSLRRPPSTRYDRRRNEKGPSMSKPPLPSEEQTILNDQVRQLADSQAGDPGTRIVIAVIGRDRPGILAGVTGILAARRANILDVSQTIMSGLFTMIMLTDIAGCTVAFADLKKELDEHGRRESLSVFIQHEDLFRTMHRV
jgi:ACT domain-containing protein